MKKTLAAVAAAGFLAVMAGPALAGPGCGGAAHNQSVGIPETSGPVAQGEQSTPAQTQTETQTETQTASTDAASE